jgi:hypothetical protein
LHKAAFGHQIKQHIQTTAQKPAITGDTNDIVRLHKLSNVEQSACQLTLTIREVVVEISQFDIKCFHD